MKFCIRKRTFALGLTVLNIAALATPASYGAAIIVSDTRTGTARVTDGAISAEDSHTTSDTSDENRVYTAGALTAFYSGTAFAQSATSFEPSTPGISGEFTGFNFQITTSGDGTSANADSIRHTLATYRSTTEFVLDDRSPWRLDARMIGTAMEAADAAAIFRIFDVVNGDNEIAYILSTAFTGNYNEPLHLSGSLQPGTYQLIVDSTIDVFFEMEAGSGNAFATFNGRFELIPEPMSVGLASLAAGLGALLIRRRGSRRN